MQIAISILGGILIVYLFFNGLAEMGIGTAGLNPFLRRRRRKWREQCRKPIYHIESPLEMTALLLVAVAENNGGPAMHDELLKLFETGFHLNPKDATELLISSEYILGDGAELHNNLKEVLRKSLRRFTKAQAASALAMIENIAGVDQFRNPQRKQLVARLNEIFRER